MASQAISPLPVVSIITPAYRAAATLDRMFDSVTEQTLGDWQHIVAVRLGDVETRASAERQARLDARVRVVVAAGVTAGAARNSALAEALGEYVLFLDADDTIAPRHLEQLLERGRSTGVEAVVSGFSRRSPDGQTISIRRIDGAPDVASLSEGPPSAIHAMLFKRSLVEQIGGFDTALRTNEDWDLCLRAAQAGARFATSPCVSAHYWTGHASLASQSVTMMQDRMTVGCLAEALAGDEAGRREIDAWRTALWTGAIAIARGSAWADIVALLLPIPPAAAEAVIAAAVLLDGFCVGYACRPEAVEAKLADSWPELVRFLAVVAELVEEPGLERAMVGALEAELARLGPTRRRTIGGTAVVNGFGMTARAQLETACQIAIRIPLVRPRSRATFLVAPEHTRGRRPVALVAGRLLETASAWPGQDRPRLAAFRDRVVRIAQLTLRAIRGRKAGAAEDLAEVSAQDLTGDDRWEAIFRSEDPWNYHCPYESLKYERTLGLLPDEPIGRALELACAEGLFSLRLADRVDHLTAADISPTALARAGERLEQHGIGNVTLQELDFFNRDIGAGWDLIVSSEVLYYMDGANAVADFAQRIAAALNSGGLFLHAHAYEVADSPERTGFDWGDAFAAATISAAFAKQPGLQLERAIETELYRIELYRKGAETAPVEVEKLSARCELHAELAADVVWNGAIVTRQAAESERRYRFPVLMYHSVAQDGPGELGNWRISPEAFEQQLIFLRRRGYRPIGLDEWDQARRGGGALSGRPVLITFDDGYRDFAETAWPILQRSGFEAHVFLVADRVGSEAEWDRYYGDPAPLMDWRAIARLASEGVTFGSHLMTHRPLDRLSFAEADEEMRRSRKLIEAFTGLEVTTLAPPYGVVSDAMRDMARAAGYERIFEVSGGLAPVAGGRFRTPRVEVSGGMSLADFAEAIGEAEGPDGKDHP